MNSLTCKFGSLALTALAFALAQQASAQQQAGSAAPTSAAGVAGVPEQQSAIFSLTARYDSNVPRTNDLQPNPRGIERSDIRISPSLQVAYARNVGRQLVGLNADLGYDFYTKNTQLNRERISVAPFVNLDLPVCDVALLGEVSRRQSELGELTYVALDPATAIDNAETRRRIDARLVCGGQYGLRPVFEYDYNRGDNSSFVRQRANFRSTRLQSGLSYSSPSLGDVSIYAFRTETDLPNQVSSTGGPSGFISRGAGLQYGRAIGSRLTVDGSVSYVDLQPRSGALSSQHGLNAGINFRLVATPRLQLMGNASRNFTSSLTSNSTYEIANTYGLSAIYAVNDRLRLRAGARISPRTFFYDVPPLGPFITDQTQTDIFAGATISPNDRLRLNFDAGYQSRSANLPFFNYKGFFVSAGVSVPL